MSDKVASLEDARKARERETPHAQGPVKCLNCGHTWQQVAPVGDIGFECPACELDRGVWTLPFHETGYHWFCACGCTVFNLTPHGALCCGCAKTHQYADLVELPGHG